MRIGVLNAEDRDRVKAFYDRMQYHGGVLKSDLVLAAEDGREIVGVVRLCEEEGELVLRGMYLREDHQRNGLGTEMLHRLKTFIGPRRCWCVPFSHLTGFYGLAGFQPADRVEAPGFLRDRLARYRKQGMNVTLMMRAGKPAGAQSDRVVR